MTVVALVPIKERSERLPGKNFRDFLGQPLYRWVLETLVGMREIDKVVVNTDCPKLIEFEHEKLVVRERKRGLRGNRVSMNEIIRDDIAEFPANWYVQTHVTNPLLSSSVVRKGLLMVHGHDSLMGVDVVRARCQFANGVAINHGGSVLAPTQDLPPVLVENSNLFVFTGEGFRKYGSRVGGDVYYLEIPRWMSVDIDTWEDWRHAELIGRGLNRE